MFNWQLRHKNQNLLTFSDWILLGGFFVWLASGLGVQITNGLLRTEQNSTRFSERESLQKHSTYTIRTNHYKKNPLSNTLETSAALFETKANDGAFFPVEYTPQTVPRTKVAMLRKATQRAPPYKII